MTVVTAKLF